MIVNKPWQVYTSKHCHFVLLTRQLFYLALQIMRHSEIHFIMEQMTRFPDLISLLHICLPPKTQPIKNTDAHCQLFYIAILYRYTTQVLIQ